MAEAFAKLHGSETVEPYTAGSRPSGQVNTRAIATMRGIGYDLTSHRSKSLSDIPQDVYAYAIIMGYGDACPLVRAEQREDWGIPDPKEMAPDEFRAVRNTIEERVQALLGRIADAHRQQ